MVSFEVIIEYPLVSGICSQLFLVTTPHGVKVVQTDQYKSSVYYIVDSDMLSLGYIYLGRYSTCLTTAPDTFHKPLLVSTGLPPQVCPSILHLSVMVAIRLYRQWRNQIVLNIVHLLWPDQYEYDRCIYLLVPRKLHAHFPEQPWINFVLLNLIQEINQYCNGWHEWTSQMA